MSEKEQAMTEERKLLEAKAAEEQKLLIQIRAQLGEDAELTKQSKDFTKLTEDVKDIFPRIDRKIEPNEYIFPPPIKIDAMTPLMYLNWRTLELSARWELQNNAEPNNPQAIQYYKELLKIKKKIEGEMAKLINNQTEYAKNKHVIETINNRIEKIEHPEAYAQRQLLLNKKVEIEKSEKPIKQKVTVKGE